MVFFYWFEKQIIFHTFVIHVHTFSLWLVVNLMYNLKLAILGKSYGLDIMHVEDRNIEWSFDFCFNPRQTMMHKGIQLLLLNENYLLIRICLRICYILIMAIGSTYPHLSLSLPPLFSILYGVQKQNFHIHIECYKQFVDFVVHKVTNGDMSNL